MQSIIKDFIEIATIKTDFLWFAALPSHGNPKLFSSRKIFKRNGRNGFIFTTRAIINYLQFVRYLERKNRHSERN